MSLKVQTSSTLKVTAPVTMVCTFFGTKLYLFSESVELVVELYEIITKLFNLTEHRTVSCVRTSCSTCYLIKSLTTPTDIVPLQGLADYAKNIPKIALICKAIDVSVGR